MKEVFKQYVKYLVLVVLISVPIFGHLNTMPIRVWDEARLAINAYEMLQNGDFIVTHYDGNPDMWNTKPPLLIWIQVLFMKVIGVNELAIRLPSAFAALFTCMVLLILSIKYLRSFWFGFIAILILITSEGYVSLHVTRTGDYDALLTLFTTASGLVFFAFCEKPKRGYLYLFFALTALAVLTKSISGLMFLPALALYSVIRRQFIPLLKNKHFYIGLFAFLCVVLGYYFLREASNPGYLAAVQENELGGRYLEVIENHKHGFWYYFDNFINFKLTTWYLLVPCGVVTGFVVKNRRINRLTLFSLLMALTYFLIISTAQTQLHWYDAPLYPFLAILMAMFIYCIFYLLEKSTLINQNLTVNIAPFVFLFLIGINPYNSVLDKTVLPKENSFDSEYYEIGYFLKDAINGKYDLNDQYLLFDGYNAHNMFYLNILKDQGVQISFKDWRNLSSGDIAIAHQKNVKEYIDKHYQSEVLKERGNVLTYKIYGERE